MVGTDETVLAIFVIGSGSYDRQDSRFWTPIGRAQELPLNLAQDGRNRLLGAHILRKSRPTYASVVMLCLCRSQGLCSNRG